VPSTNVRDYLIFNQRPQGSNRDVARLAQLTVAVEELFHSHQFKRKVTAETTGGIVQLTPQFWAFGYGNVLATGFRYLAWIRISNPWVGCSVNRDQLRSCDFPITGARSLHPTSLVIEQPFLAPQSTAVPAQRAIRANNPVTRDNDANHVRAVCAAGCAARVFVPEFLCHPGIGACFAGWD